MSMDIVLGLTALWLLLGLIGLHWASMIEARDEARRWEALEQALAEAVREKARQAAELEAMRADLRNHGAAVRC
jgi:Tfp pilus assembly protein PilO